MQAQPRARAGTGATASFVATDESVGASGGPEGQLGVQLDSAFGISTFVRILLSFAERSEVALQGGVLAEIVVDDRWILGAGASVGHTQWFGFCFLSSASCSVPDAIEVGGELNATYVFLDSGAEWRRGFGLGAHVRLAQQWWEDERAVDDWALRAGVRLAYEWY